MRKNRWYLTPLVFLEKARGNEVRSNLFFYATYTYMDGFKIKVRDLRNGDWYWISKLVIEAYGPKIKPIGIAIYNCLAKHANQQGFCFPSHKAIAKEIGSSVATVKRGIEDLLRFGLIRKERKKYCNIYYLLKLPKSR